MGKRFSIISVAGPRTPDRNVEMSLEANQTGACVTEEILQVQIVIFNIAIGGCGGMLV